METKYPSNSHKSKEKQQEPAIVEKQPMEKIVTGKVVKKKSVSKKFTDIFVSEDANSVGQYVLMDIIVPSMKKLLVDIVSDGIRMIAYGERGSSSKRGVASTISYRTDYSRASDRRYNDVSSRARTGYSYDEVYLESRGEAEDVLTRLDEVIDEYGMVSVADMYDLVGVTGNYTDYKYGWTDIRTASVVRTRDGYMIKMPRAVALK